MVETVLAGLDRRRFPWVGEGREPHEDEKAAAALATASLMATERVRTLRRNEARVAQEAAVAEALRAAGFREVGAPRVIRTLEEAPGPGEFCTERTFGDRKADLVVGLWDRRRMPLECKASNSATNSYKRVNHEAAEQGRDLAAGLRPQPGRARRGAVGGLQAGQPGGRPDARAHAAVGPPPGRPARLDLTHPPLRRRGAADPPENRPPKPRVRTLSCSRSSERA